jgi:hypothetical protein
LTIPHFTSTDAQITGSAGATTTTTTSSGGGGGGGGTTYTVGLLTATPVIKDLGAGDRIRYTVDNKNYTLSFLGMTASSATVLLTTSSVTITKSFTINQSRTVDVNNDGKDDIQVTLNSISPTSSTANFEVKSLTVAASSEPVTPTENVTTPITPITPETIIPDETTEPTTTPFPWMKWTLIGAVGVILVVVVILFMNLKKK